MGSLADERLDQAVALLEQLVAQQAALASQIDAIKKVVDGLPSHLYRIENQTRGY